MTQNVWIVMDGKGNPLWYTVSQLEEIAKRKVQNNTVKTWKMLSEGLSYTILNVDLEIKLRD